MNRTIAFMLSVIAVPAFAAGEMKHGEMTTTDGIKIHYIEQGESVPVVLVHGYTGSAEGNWFSNGVAEALAPNHRVIAIDVRGHGASDKPKDAALYGERIWKDVLELMDHLNIEKAHLHGYSMGGAITTQLLIAAPERFITAAYGGSGVRERDPELRKQIPADKDGTDPQEAEARQTLGGSPSRDEDALGLVRQTWASAFAKDIDLSTISIPVLAINGEFDGPNAKTHRLARELTDFESVVLPGKSHLTAIMAGYIPDLYITSLVKFINDHDPK